jgi:hypothetical protein
MRCSSTALGSPARPSTMPPAMPAPRAATILPVLVPPLLLPPTSVLEVLAWLLPASELLAGMLPASTDPTAALLAASTGAAAGSEAAAGSGLPPAAAGCGAGAVPRAVGCGAGAVLGAAAGAGAGAARLASCTGDERKYDAQLPVPRPLRGTCREAAQPGAGAQGQSTGTGTPPAPVVAGSKHISTLWRAGLRGREALWRLCVSQRLKRTCETYTWRERSMRILFCGLTCVNGLFVTSMPRPLLLPLPHTPRQADGPESSPVALNEGLRTEGIGHSRRQLAAIHAGREVLGLQQGMWTGAASAGLPVCEFQRLCTEREQHGTRSAAEPSTQPAQRVPCHTNH